MSATSSPCDPDEQSASFPEFPDITLPPHSSAPQAAPDARRVLLARHGSAPGAGNDDRAVHLLPLPFSDHADGTAQASALCGIRMPPGDLQTVAPGEGDWCQVCFIAHLTGYPPAAPSMPEVSQRGPDADGYRKLGWPITRRGQDVSVHLDVLQAVALVIPALLATEVAEILLRRRCSPAVLVHPSLPTHRIILAGERFGVALGWPAGTHRVTGTLVLPPTVTARGPLLWTHPPQPDALRLTREIDVAAALRSALREPPASSSPAHF